MIGRLCRLETVSRDFACCASRGKRRTCLTGTMGSAGKVSVTLRTLRVRVARHKGGRGSSAAWGWGQRLLCTRDPRSTQRQKRVNFHLGQCVSSFECCIYPYNSSVSFNPLTRKQETASKFAIEQLPASMMPGGTQSEVKWPFFPTRQREPQKRIPSPPCSEKGREQGAQVRNH